eukprot:1788835-Rhodomonas_salina.1
MRCPVLTWRMLLRLSYALPAYAATEIPSTHAVAHVLVEGRREEKREDRRAERRKKRESKDKQVVPRTASYRPTPTLVLLPVVLRFRPTLILVPLPVVLPVAILPYHMLPIALRICYAISGTDVGIVLRDR